MVTGQLTDKLTGSQSSRGLVNSRTSQLAEIFDLQFGVYNSSVLGQFKCVRPKSIIRHSTEQISYRYGYFIPIYISQSIIIAKSAKKNILNLTRLLVNMVKTKTI